MTTTTRHRIALALLAGVTALTATACGGDQGGSSPDPTVTVTETTAPTTSATSSTPTGAASSPSSLPATSSPRVTQGADGTCTTAQLRVDYADDQGGAGAGSVTGAFTFTNTGDDECTLRGYPGVSYVTGSEGEQVGQPASRATDTVATKTLRPGDTVEAPLRRSQAGNYGDDCQETDVRGFRVYPPGSTAAVFVRFPTTGCKSPNAPLLQVGPVA